MKLKYNTLIILGIKIILTSIVVFSISKNITHKGSLMNGSELTSIGLNSFYTVDYDSKIKIQSFKVILLSTFVFIMFISSLIKINNFYEGLKEIIRIKSKNLLDYFIKTGNFILKYVFIDVLITIATIFITMVILKIDGTFSIDVFKQLFLMSLFYIILPFILIFLIDKIEYFLIGIFSLTIFADYLIYKLDFIHIFISYFILITLTYGLILFKERIK